MHAVCRFRELEKVFLSLNRIRIWKNNRYDIKEFGIEFKVSEFKRFALMLAETYLEEVRCNPIKCNKAQYLYRRKGEL